MTFTVLGTVRHLRSVARTNIPIFNDQNFSTYLPGHLISLLNKILFVKTDTVFSVKLKNSI